MHVWLAQTGSTEDLSKVTASLAKQQPRNDESRDAAASASREAPEAPEPHDSELISWQGETEGETEQTPPVSAPSSPTSSSSRVDLACN